MAESEEPRRKNKSKIDRSERRKKKAGGPSLGLWLGIGGGVAAIVVVAVVLVMVLGGGQGGLVLGLDQGQDAEAFREGGGSEAHTIVKRIETKISLWQTAAEAAKTNPHIRFLLMEKGMVEGVEESANMQRHLLFLSGSADASLIAVAYLGKDRKYVINRGPGKVVAEYDTRSLERHVVFRPLVSPDGKLVIYEPRLRITNDRKLEVQDLATGKVVKALGDETFHNFEAVAFSPKSDTLYALAHAKSDSVIAGWSTANWEQVFHLKMPENRTPQNLIPLADGKTVVTVTTGGKPRIDIFDVGQKKQTKSIVLQYRTIGVATLSPDGKMLAFFADPADGKHLLCVMDVDRAQQVCTINPPHPDAFSSVEDMRFLPSGNLCLASGWCVAAFDPKTGQQKAVWNLNYKVGGRNNITTQFICANGEIIQVLDGNTATFLVARLKE